MTMAGSPEARCARDGVVIAMVRVRQAGRTDLKTAAWEAGARDGSGASMVLQAIAATT